MAKNNRTTSTPRRATAAKAPPSPKEIICRLEDEASAEAYGLGHLSELMTGAKRFPSETQWREYQAAVTAINAREADDKDLEATFREAQERFVYAEDATLQGIYLKLRLLAETESLSSNLDEGPHLLLPRIILTILRDLKALGSLQEPTGAY